MLLALLFVCCSCFNSEGDMDIYNPFQKFEFNEYDRYDSFLKKGFIERKDFNEFRVFEGSKGEVELFVFFKKIGNGEIILESAKYKINNLNSENIFSAEFENQYNVVLVSGFCDSKGVNKSKVFIRNKYSNIIFECVYFFEEEYLLVPFQRIYTEKVELKNRKELFLQGSFPNDK